MSKHLCLLPWIHLEAVETGFARPCCKAEEYITKENGEAFHLGKDDIKNIWNSAYMNKLREQFMNGEQPSVCKKCWLEEASGVDSKRIVSNQKYAEFAKRPHEALQRPVYFDLKLGNICNLKCRTCCSASSTKWVSEEIDLNPSLKDQASRNVKLGKWSTDNALFWDSMDDFAGDALYFDFTGGEPFLIKEHFSLLESLIKKGSASKISLHYNSNGTIFPKLAVESIWPHFKAVELMLSIDGVGEKFEYIRHPAKWDEVKANIELFKSHKYIDLSICHSISSLNIISIPEFHDWAQENELSFWLNIIHGPPHYNVCSFSKKAKISIADKLLQHQYTPQIRSEVENLVNFMLGHDIETDSTLLQQTQMHDKYRNETMSDVLPELWSLLTSENRNE